MLVLSFLLVLFSYGLWLIEYAKLGIFFEWQCGVDASATDRVLLQSLKPSLHTNVDCTALVASVIHRQVPVVDLLLQVIFTIAPFKLLIIVTILFSA